MILLMQKLTIAGYIIEMCSYKLDWKLVPLVNINKKYESIACNIVICAYQIVSVWMTFR